MFLSERRVVAEVNFSRGLFLLACLMIHSAQAQPSGKPAVGAEERVVEKPLPNTVFTCRQGKDFVYTNTRLDKNCKATVLTPMVAVVPLNNATPAGASSAASAGDFPKVTEATQKARDQDRRRILDDEIMAEQKHLDAAKTELMQQEAKAAKEEKNYQKLVERLQPHKDKVAQHERNLQALKKEISLLPK